MTDETVAGPDVQASEPVSEVPAVHYWDGQFRRVPAGWRLPGVNVATAWRLWWFGDEEKGITAFRNLTGHDLCSRHLKRSFSEWKTLFDRVQAYLAEQDAFVATPTHEEASAMLQAAEPFFKSRHTGKRPYGVLKMTTISRKFRNFDARNLVELIENEETAAS